MNVGDSVRSASVSCSPQPSPTQNSRPWGPGAPEVPEVLVVGLLGVLAERGREHEVQKTAALGGPPAVDLASPGPASPESPRILCFVASWCQTASPVTVVRR